MEDSEDQTEAIEVRAERLRLKIESVELASWSRVGPHRKLADRWGRASLWTTWAAAFSAALSTVTIIADRNVLAAGLAIAAAAFSTFIATAKPAEHAAAHNSARVGYEAVQDSMRDTSFDLPRSGVTQTQLRVAQKLYDTVYGRFTELKATSPSVEPEPFPL